ncbi:hypothetical protein C8F04DRAFT_1180384 [Mycena alexandri]|uniref:Uncharacterized protein n=1 Tax=Mycena alexandri TaxID=1745969 RepID=A0AAD6T1X9_9AGAR|nr:hypothetical protein C8F04DRAFT_1180384 [Mycena alexandri]
MEDKGSPLPPPEADTTEDDKEPGDELGEGWNEMAPLLEPDAIEYDALGDDIGGAWVKDNGGPLPLSVIHEELPEEENDELENEVGEDKDEEEPPVLKLYTEEEAGTENEVGGGWIYDKDCDNELATAVENDDIPDVNDEEEDRGSWVEESEREALEPPTKGEEEDIPLELKSEVGGGWTEVSDSDPVIPVLEVDTAELGPTNEEEFESELLEDEVPEWVPDLAVVLEVEPVTGLDEDKGGGWIDVRDPETVVLCAVSEKEGDVDVTEDIDSGPFKVEKPVILAVTEDAVEICSKISGIPRAI